MHAAGGSALQPQACVVLYLRTLRPITMNGPVVRNNQFADVLSGRTCLHWTPMLQTFVRRHLPRTRPGTGPTSRVDMTLKAEVAHLSAEMTRLVKEQQVQFRRIAELQQQIDEILRLLKSTQR